MSISRPSPSGSSTPGSNAGACGAAPVDAAVGEEGVVEGAVAEDVVVEGAAVEDAAEDSGARSGDCVAQAAHSETRQHASACLAARPLTKLKLKLPPARGRFLFNLVFQLA